MTIHLPRPKTTASPANFPDDAIWFDENGLHLPSLQPSPHRDVRERPDHLELLLALAFRQRLPAPVLTAVVKAAEDSRRGDHALANLRLALGRLSRAPASHDLPRRVRLAETLLAEGVTPADLLDALERPTDEAVAKFDPEQPRVPAGSGRESGQWTRDGETTGPPSRATAIAVAASRGASLFATDLPAGFVAGLSSLAATLGAAAVVGGVLFVPWQKDVTSSGALPGDPDHTYSYNSDEGLLQIRDASGDVVAAGHADKLGIFHDADTGVAFGGQIDDALVFDGAQMTAAQDSDEAAAASLAEAGTEDDEPKLCPDKIPDNPGVVSMSARAIAYQEQISRMINPQRPLSFGWAMGLINPETGKLVRYDDCAEQTGTMIDAKGPGYSGLLSFPRGEESVTTDFTKYSLREIQAAGSRQVEWYFAEPSAAEFAQKLFVDLDQGREKIVIKVQAPE